MEYLFNACSMRDGVLCFRADTLCVQIGFASLDRCTKVLEQYNGVSFEPNPEP